MADDSTPTLVEVTPVIDKPTTGLTPSDGAKAAGEFIGGLLVAIFSASRDAKLTTEIADLREEIKGKAEAAQDALKTSKEMEEKVAALKEIVAKLEKKERLAHLIHRVCPAAAAKLQESPEFLENFEREQSAFALAIDLRRSTELMLKARQPKEYAKFMIELSGQFKSEIIANYGVFDKFTGDGVLAFFPEFYSGPKAGMNAVHTARRCHQFCKEHFAKNRRIFNSSLLEVGVGIGLDYGPVQIVQFGGEVTIVGTPVVYASRMAAAPAGHTYANQPAFDALTDTFGRLIRFAETEIDIKADGKTIAYDIDMVNGPFGVFEPDWAKKADPTL